MFFVIPNRFIMRKSIGFLYILALMVFSGIPVLAQDGALVDRIAAWVGEDGITLGEVEEALVRYEASGDMGSGGVTEERLRAALELLIDETVLVKAAEKGGVEVPSEVIDNRVDETIKSMEQRQGSPEALDAALAKTGRTRERLRDMLRKQMHEEFLIARAVDSRIDITDDEVVQFEKARQAAKQPIVRYNLAQFFLPVPLKATDEEWRKAMETAHEVRIAAKSGGDFVRTVSDWIKAHPDSKAEGGALGAVAPDEMQPALTEAAAQLKPGESCAPIRGERGVHVLYLFRKTTSRQMLYAERFKDERAKWAKQLREQLSIQIVAPLIDKEKEEE
jgi:parvulin-like peptidyl-prolyl isomerase